MTFFSALCEMLTYPFVLRALAAGIAVSLAASILGVVLVLKRFAMIGHGLADVGFAALSLALAFDLAPLYIAMPVLVAASFVIMASTQRRGVSGDIAVGVVSTGALATGIIVTATTRGFNIDVYNYMFGSILATSASDVVAAVAVSLGVVGTFAVFYNRLFLVTCDENYARALGIDVRRYHFLISLLTAFAVVVGMRLMGTLLISSLIVFPAVTARKLAGSFRALVIAAGIVSCVCFVAGVFFSFLFDLPVGASVVAANIAAMLLAEGIKRLLGGH